MHSNSNKKERYKKRNKRGNQPLASDQQEPSGESEYSESYLQNHASESNNRNHNRHSTQQNVQKQVLPLPLLGPPPPISTNRNNNNKSHLKQRKAPIGKHSPRREEHGEDEEWYPSRSPRWVNNITTKYVVHIMMVKRIFLHLWWRLLWEHSLYLSNTQCSFLYTQI